MSDQAYNEPEVIPPKKDSSWTKKAEAVGNSLFAQAKKVLAAGNTRRMLIVKPSGEILLKMSLTVGIVIIALVTLFAPYLAAIGALAALFARYKIDVIRNDEM